jgi:hypothetical protein
MMAEKTAVEDVTVLVQQSPQPPHSVFPKWQRVTYIYIASLAAFTSPVSNSIYYPAMVTLAEDLDTTITKIGFTITSYMVRISYSYLFKDKANFT